MECVYNNRFKRWVPKNISKNKIVYRNDIYNFKKK